MPWISKTNLINYSLLFHWLHKHTHTLKTLMIFDSEIVIHIKLGRNNDLTHRVVGITGPWPAQGLTWGRPVSGLCPWRACMWTSLDHREPLQMWRWGSKADYSLICNQGQQKRTQTGATRTFLQLFMVQSFTMDPVKDRCKGTLTPSPGNAYIHFVVVCAVT